MSDEIDLTRSELFAAPFYTRHDHRRLEHLASLGLDLHDKTVIEPGAGIGNHSLFYADRGCHVTAIEPRADNCAMFRANLQGSWSPYIDSITIVEAPYSIMEEMDETFDIVHSYGFLYHVGEPDLAIALMAKCTNDLLIMETCVSTLHTEDMGLLEEPSQNPSQAFDGKACRPSRSWIKAELGHHFEHVYLTRTQPAHDEFPLNWNAPVQSKTGLTRAVFVASRRPLDNQLLTTSIPTSQRRC